ncbi:hypothetical protein [Alkalimonas amylolytica]|uniref:Uncharacterized protein n=1 Tax=Alkalimonas amylolytica TaxID=152573 RepID=A0A1H4DCU8_ALKAM|nr:hypothetical protein [Alkalimonas amylolytica]SEA70270.1 hypothetical protein SAMN04488051_105174 [Alkalimonas amylolytica]
MATSFLRLLTTTSVAIYAATLGAVVTEPPPVQTAKLPYTQTSVLHLLVHPDRYYNRNIRVSGYYLPSVGLTISKDEQLQYEFAAPLLDSASAFSGTECDQQWVVLEGHFLPVFAQEERTIQGRIIADRLTVMASDEVCWQRTEPVNLEQVGS